MTVVRLVLPAVCFGAALRPAEAADQPQWGQPLSRNMVSAETGLPVTFNLETGANVKWTAPLGTQTYATPIVADGRVYLGTNNDRPRDPRRLGDRGVLLCLDERDGHLLWQLVVAKRGGDPYLDWPRVGICSPPTVEGDRLYVVTNRGEVLCLDTRGLANGNQGLTDEATLLAAPGEAPVPLGPTDADVLWRFDMPTEVGIWTHDSAHVSILVHEDLLYLNTGNGVDNTHKVLRRPQAPCLIVLHKATGRLVAREQEGIGSRVFHCSWSSPALGLVAEAPLLFYAGPDGVVYGFDPPEPDAPWPQTLRKRWSFDCDPTAPKENIASYLRNRTEGPSVIHGMPVFLDGRLYVAGGGDMWWGKNSSWLKCLEPTPEGVRQVWSSTFDGRTCSTPAVSNGLIFLGDSTSRVQCFDAATGEVLWTHKCNGPIWGSTLIAQGRIYVGTRRGELCVLTAGRTPQVLSTTRLDGPIHGTPTAANGVLYVATMKTLYAIGSVAQVANL